MANKKITIEKDIKEVKKNFVSRDEFEDLMSRIKYIEEKLGIKSGEYVFYCGVPGHRGRGEVGKMIVK